MRAAFELSGAAALELAELAIGPWRPAPGIAAFSAGADPAETAETVWRVALPRGAAAGRAALALRLDMASFRELAAFAQFGSDLDKSTQSQLNRGQRLQEILKQPQYEPMSLENQVTVIFAGTQGYADKVPLDRMRAWEQALLRFMVTSHPEIGRDNTDKNRVTDENIAALRLALEEFTHTWQ